MFPSQELDPPSEADFPTPSPELRRTALYKQAPLEYLLDVCMLGTACRQSPPRAGPTSGHLSRTRVVPGTEQVLGKWLMGLVNGQRNLLGVGRKEA